MKAGWQTKTLGDVCHVYQPETISQNQMVAGEFPVYGANGRIGWHNQFNHEDPQLILGCRGSCGTVHITEPRAWINGNAMVVQPKNGVIELPFLAYALKGGIELADAITGTAQPQITRTSLMPLAISFPMSIPEQRRIVGILDEVFEGIAFAKTNTEKNLQNTHVLFESHLHSVFTQRGKGWVEKPLSELCDIKHGFAFKSEFFASEGDYVLLTPGNFYESGGYRYRGEKQKYYIGEIPRDYVLSKGDLLVAMTEQAAGLLGSPILVPESDRFLHNQRLGLVTKKPGVPWTNEFFFHVFNTQPVRKEIHDSASGVKVRHTSPTKIGEVIVSFPTSLTEQHAIVSKLKDLREETQRLESIYQQKLSALESLKKSLLHQAFTGQLAGASV
ncbi:MAG: restriction endonuclease subunit S [Sedimentisphaerales bacterium]